MTIAVFGEYIDPVEIHYFTTLEQVAEELNIKLVYYDRLVKLLLPAYPEAHNFEQFSSLDFNPDFLVTLGGDGTILSAVRIVGDRGIPILGINLGRLGFMAKVEKSITRQALIQLINGDHTYEKRSLLQLDTDDHLFDPFPFALNDMTIVKRDTSSMIVIHISIDGEFLNSYWADGVIIATPTGSTGYNLSCGGPILIPTASNFIITPIAPHNLNVRPLVLHDDSVIEITAEGRTENFLCTLDSRYEMITAETKLKLTKAPFQIKMVNLSEITFLSTMRNKLMWGRDSRNFK